MAMINKEIEVRAREKTEELSSDEPAWNESNNEPTCTESISENITTWIKTITECDDSWNKKVINSCLDNTKALNADETACERKDPIITTCSIWDFTWTKTDWKCTASQTNITPWISKSVNLNWAFEM